MYKTSKKYRNINQSYVLAYYIPAKYGISDESTLKIHDLIIYELKEDKISINNPLVKYASKKCYNELFGFNIDFVVRALGSNELKVDKSNSKSMNIIGKSIAKELSALYKPELLKSNRSEKIRSKLHLSSSISNRPDIINNDKLEFENLSNKNLKSYAPSILIIDDVTTSGSTAEGIAKSIKEKNPKAKIYFFAISETCSVSYVSDERKEYSVKRNNVFIKQLNNQAIDVYSEVEKFENKKDEKVNVDDIESLFDRTDNNVNNDKIPFNIEEKRRIAKIKRDVFWRKLEAEKKKKNKLKAKKKKEAQKKLILTQIDEVIKQQENEDEKDWSYPPEEMELLVEQAKKERDKRRKKIYEENKRIRKIKSQKEKEVKEKDLERLKIVKERKRKDDLKIILEKKKLKKDQYVRIFQIAKEVNVSHNDIMSFLKSKNISVTSHMTSIDLRAQKMIFEEFLNKKQKVKKKEFVKNITSKKDSKVEIKDNKISNKKNRPKKYKKFKPLGNLLELFGFLILFFFLFIYTDDNILVEEFQYDNNTNSNNSSYNKRDYSKNNKNQKTNEYFADSYTKNNEFLKRYNKKNIQKNPSKVEKINICDPKIQFHPYDIPARLSNVRSNFVSIGKKILKRNGDYSTWNIYLEATQFHNGKFKRHRKKEKVIVKCFIDYRGKILNTSIIQNSTNNYFFEGRAKEFVKELKFIPAKKGYKNVCMWISVPVYFSKRR